jgi:hypothetical protein
VPDVAGCCLKELGVRDAGTNPQPCVPAAEDVTPSGLSCRYAEDAERESSIFLDSNDRLFLCLKFNGVHGIIAWLNSSMTQMLLPKTPQKGKRVS